MRVVVLSGELDLTNAEDVEDRLGDPSDDRVVLDLTRVTFLDSAALHMIFRLARRQSPAQPLGICIDPGAPIARTLAIVGLHEVATVRPRLEELAPTELAG
jgi:anti-anti-sigma factor